MHNLPPIFARLINPGVVLSHELSLKIFNYDNLNREQNELDNEIAQIRKKQDSIEDQLAEALAEDEFQRCQSGQLTMANEEELLEIFKQHLGRVIDKLAMKYERKIYQEMDLRKMKLAIEKEIVMANEQTAAVNND
ncbi:hypothetical protein KR222_005645 [Zaprionus bogoriensis]|nr:hypothetical protein KR222_005645 [Zaprionus bogoriensis]